MKFVLKINTFKISSELSFVLYFWGFMILRPILLLAGQFSFMILLSYALMLIVAPIVTNRKCKINLNLLAIIAAYALAITIDLLVRSNSAIKSSITEYIIYGVIPMFLLSQVSNIKLLIDYFSRFSVVILFAYGWTPFADYMFFAEYMDFGFNFALPVFLGIATGRRLFNRKWLFFEILALGVCLFASRSILLSIGFYYLYIYIIKGENTKKRLIYLITIGLACLVIYIYRRPIVVYLYDYMMNSDFYSYSVHKIYLMIITNDVMAAFSSRTDLWLEALQMLDSIPHILFGNGTASYYDFMDNYPHNIIMDLLTQYGIVGLAFTVIIIYHSFKRISIEDQSFKALGLLFLCLWFPKLLFSLYLYKDIALWCFIALTYIPSQKFLYEDTNSLR